MEITFDRKSVNTCLQQRFTLPSYQRDYRWETKHLRDLLEDVQEQFLADYDPSHGRSKVGEYSPYFLGTIITTPAGSGTRSIVDGQQRLTTLSLILVHFFRVSKRKPDLSMSDVEPLIRRRLFGDSDFNLEFDKDRKTLIETLLDYPELEGQALDEAVESIADTSAGTREVYRVFSQVDSFILDEIKEGLMARFVDYLIERVYLFEIGVPSEQDGHKVFVTMNDRGLRLAPLDLLKGYLLSNITDDKANATASHKWAECIKLLRSLGRDEDSTFFRTWIRAQYAKTTRGKSRGSAPADFENVGDAYHRWVVENSDSMGITNSDEFYDLVERRIPFYVQQYLRIRDAEVSFSSDFPCVFYNGAKSVALQYMAILSALDVNDTSAVIDKKIKLISFYIDAFLTARVITRKDNNYDNIKDPIFTLTRLVRRKSVEEIVAILKPLMVDIEPSINSISRVEYWFYKNKDLLHLLSRIGAFIEDKTELTNKVGFSDYINRSRGNRSFDIEHTVPSTYGVSLGTDVNGLPVETDDHSDEWRDGIGGLVLLPRGKNRSLRDMAYPEKLTRYASENVLAQSLTDGFYLNNPTVNTYVQTSGMPLISEPSFTFETWQRRTALYEWIATQIWNVSHVDDLAA
jgi:hypothetical protein